MQTFVLTVLRTYYLLLPLCCEGLCQVGTMQEFLQNISRYPRFLVTIILGILLNVAQPFAPLFKRPSTAIATSGLVLAGFAFLVFTLRAMLGLNVS